MNKRIIILIIVFVVLAILGGLAVFIGYRLQQEEEVTPKEAAAASCATAGCSYPGCCLADGTRCICPYGGGECYEGPEPWCNMDNSQTCTCDEGGAVNCSDCPSGQHCEGGQCKSGTVCNGCCNNDGCQITSGNCQPSAAYCRGYSPNCGNAHDTYYKGGGGSLDRSDRCVTVQIDTNASDGSYGVYWLGDNGQECRCIGGHHCDGQVYESCEMSCSPGVSKPEDLDWDCEDEPEASLSCDSLTASPSSLTTSGGDVTLTTTATASEVTVSNYDYEADVGGDSLTDGSETTTWTIPSGTTEGEYHAWVNVSGGDFGDVGCSGTTYPPECTGGGDSCMVTLDVSDEAQPDFDVRKTSSISCNDDNTQATISYTITVTNTSGDSGNVTSVEDTYDSRYQTTWISNVIPRADSHEGNVLTWNNGGDGWTLASGAELEFSYDVTLTSEYFGEYQDGELTPYKYRNVVIVLHDAGRSRATSTVEVTCVPETGIFDQAVTAALFAILLILLGFVSIRYDQELLIIGRKVGSKWPFTYVTRGVREVRKEKFEKNIRKLEKGKKKEGRK